MPTETPPEFALSFTTEAVLLLRRQGGEWVEQARADFDDPDLRNALNGLRARAEAASPGGFSTRLMIPDDQILYTTLEIDPDLPREQAVADALDGVTPYEVAELAFDWAETDHPNRLRIAALTRQTLNEAEEFARTHGFSPRGFGALPEADAFPKEPDFGPRLAVADDAPAAEPEPADDAAIEVDDWVAALGAEIADPVADEGDEPATDEAKPDTDDIADLSGDTGPAPQPAQSAAPLAAQPELPGLALAAESVPEPEAAAKVSPPAAAGRVGGAAPVISRITPHFALPVAGTVTAAVAEPPAPEKPRPVKLTSPVAADPGKAAPRINAADIAAPARDLPPVKPSVTERAAVLAERAGPLLSDLRRKSAVAAATLGDRLSRMASGAAVDEKTVEPPLLDRAPHPAGKIATQPPLDERRATTLAERLSPHVAEPLRRAGKAMTAKAMPGKPRPEQGKLRKSPAAPGQMPDDRPEAPSPPPAPRTGQPPLTVPPRAQAVLDRAAEARARRAASAPQPQPKRRAGGQYRGLMGGVAAVLAGLVLAGLLIPSAPSTEPQVPQEQDAAARTSAADTLPAQHSDSPAESATGSASAAAEPAQAPLALTRSAPPRARPDWIAARLDAAGTPAASGQPEPPLPPSTGPAPVGAVTLAPPGTQPAPPATAAQVAKPAAPAPAQPGATPATPVAPAASTASATQDPAPSTPTTPTPRPAPEPDAATIQAAVTPEPAIAAPVARPTETSTAPDPRQANRAGEPAPDAAPVVPPSPQPFAQRDQTPLRGIRPRARPDDLAERIAAAVAAQRDAQSPDPAPVSDAPVPTAAATEQPQPDVAPVRLEHSARPRPRPALRSPAPAPEAPLEEGAAAEPEQEAALTPAERSQLLALQRDLRTAQAGGRAPTAEERELIRKLGARPQRKPLNVNGASQEAVARAVGEALGDAAARSASTAGLSRDNRPLRRPASVLARAGGASGSGGVLDSQAVDNAIASAIAESGAAPGGVALTALASSPIPARRPTQIVPEPSMPPLPPPVIAAPDPIPVPDPIPTQPRQVAVAPAPQPSAVSRQVVVAPPLEVDDEPEPVKVSRGGTTAAGIAKTATQKDKLDMGRTTLIGTFGTGRTSRALVRTSSGRFVKLKVGDQIEGGRVAEISTGKLVYVKGSRQQVMTILNER